MLIEVLPTVFSLILQVAIYRVEGPVPFAVTSLCPQVGPLPSIERIEYLYNTYKYILMKPTKIAGYLFSESGYPCLLKLFIVGYNSLVCFQLEGSKES